MSPGSESPDFTALVHEHWTVVFRCLMQMTGSTHDAEELTQETFLRALQAKLTADQHPRAWLLRVARNAWLDLARRRTAVKFEALPAERATIDDPGHLLEVAEEAAKLNAILAGLTELTRSVFLLRVEGDLPFADIAAVLDTTERACRWHMHQARSRILQELRKDDNHDDL